MKYIILIGAPGCGKGTQSAIISENFDLLQVTLGDVLRSYKRDNNNKFSSKISNLFDKGNLLPDDLINEIAHDFVSNNKKSISNGVLFDGYPRSINQAKFIDKMIQEEFNSKISHVIFLDISLDDIIVRLQNRYMCKKCAAIYNKVSKRTKKEGICDICNSTEFSTRVDDSEIDIIRVRLEEFKVKTEPLIEYYSKQNIFSKINASTYIDEVYNKISEIIS